MQTVHVLLTMRVHSPRCATVARCCFSWFEEDNSGAETVYFWNPGANDVKREWRAGKVQVPETLYKAALCLRLCCNTGLRSEMFATATCVAGYHRADFMKHVEAQFFDNPLFCDVCPALEGWADGCTEDSDESAAAWRVLLDIQDNEQQVPPSYTRECLHTFWVEQEICKLEPPMQKINANNYRHVHATNLYHLYFEQPANDMFGQKNPFLGLSWEQFVSKAAAMMNTGPKEFEFTYCAVKCAHNTRSELASAAVAAAAT